MKRLLYIIVALIIMSLLNACFTTMTPEERKATYDLRESVGWKTFVGDPSVDSRGMTRAFVYGG